MQRKTLITIIQLVVFLGVGVAVVWYMFDRMSDDQRTKMFAAVRETNLWLLLPVFLVTLLAHWARARRWQLLLQPLSIHPSTANTVFAVLIGYLINLAVPRAGEVAKCTVLARYEKVPADKMVGTIVAERAWDMVCLVIVVAGGLLWQAAFLDDELKNQLLRYAPKGAALTVTLLAIGVIVGLMIAVVRLRPRSKVARFFWGLGAGVSSIFRLRQRGLFMLYTFMIWGGYLAQILLGFWSLEGTAHLGLGPAIMVLIFGSVAMIGSQGGLGLYPLLVGLLLSNGYGIPPEAANAFGWVSWLTLTGIVMILGIVSLLLLPVYNRTPHDAQAPVDSAQNL